MSTPNDEVSFGLPNSQFDPTSDDLRIRDHHSFNIIFDIVEGSPYVHVIGPLEAPTSPVLNRCLNAVIETYAAAHLFIDLTDVTHLDASGLAVLKSARQRIEEDGGRLDLVVPQHDRLWQVDLIDLQGSDREV